MVKTKSGPSGDTTTHAGTQGLIFVVDCADVEHMDEARQELHLIINDREMKP